MRITSEIYGMLSIILAYVYWKSQKKRREKRSEKFFEEIMAKHFPNFIKN